MSKKSEKETAKLATQLMAEKRAELMETIPSETLSAKLVKSLNINAHDELKSIAKLFASTQDARISAESQYRNYLISRLDAGDNPEDIKGDGLLYMYLQQLKLEENLKKILTTLTNEIPICKWMCSIPGIGPIHAAMLYSYIDINKAPTAGHIWSYAGWDVGYKRPTKGQKCNWNREFRSRCYLISDSFVKVRNNEHDIYGHLYQAKKQLYIQKNESGGFAEKAALELEYERKKKNPSKACIEKYEEGKITDLQIEYMARRFAVKVFLAHLQEVWYELEFGERAPKPYAITYLDHVHVIKCPNKDVVGLPDSYKANNR